MQEWPYGSLIVLGKNNSLSEKKKYKMQKTQFSYAVYPLLFGPYWQYIGTSTLLVNCHCALHKEREWKRIGVIVFKCNEK